MSEEKNQKLKKYQKKYCEANKSKKSWFHKKKEMHGYVHNKLHILLIFLLSLYPLSYPNNDMLWYPLLIHFCFRFKYKHKNGKRINKVCIIIYLLLQITITEGYKLNTTIIYTKMTNNDDIKPF